MDILFRKKNRARKCTTITKCTNEAFTTHVEICTIDLQRLIFALCVLYINIDQMMKLINYTVANQGNMMPYLVRNTVYNTCIFYSY